MGREHRRTRRARRALGTKPGDDQGLGRGLLLGSLSRPGSGHHLLDLTAARDRRPVVCRHGLGRPLSHRAGDGQAARGGGSGVRYRQPSRLTAGFANLDRGYRRARRCRLVDALARLGLGGRTPGSKGGVMPKVLIADGLSPRASEILMARGIVVDFAPGLPAAELKERIAVHDGLVVRSATKVTKGLLVHAKRLRVIGPAGIGIDNIDVE